jgi:hypothetical protein
MSLPVDLSRLDGQKLGQLVAEALTEIVRRRLLDHCEDHVAEVHERAAAAVVFDARVDAALRIGRLIAEVLADILPERGTVVGADVSPRPRKESERWREEVNPTERSDHIDTMGDGESSWSQREAKELLRTMRTRRKRDRSSDRSSGSLGQDERSGRRGRSTRRT